MSDARPITRQRERTSSNNGHQTPIECGRKKVVRLQDGKILEDWKPWTYNNTYFGRQNISIERCFDEIHPGHPAKGGPFDKFLVKDGGLTLKGDPEYCTVPYEYNGYEYRYKGQFICKYGPTHTYLDPDRVFKWTIGNNGASESFGNITDWGPTAWKRFRPGRPGAQLAVSIAELADITRMLKTTALAFRDSWRAWKGYNRGRKLSKVAANNHLNNQFGWLPFVSDIKGLYELYHDMDKRLQQLIRDNGRWIRRKGIVYHDKPTATNYREFEQTAHFPSLGPYYGVANPNGWHSISVYAEQLVWFSGKFRYYIPDIQSVKWKATARAKLFGAWITPETIWELVPFSWLVDYFSTVGDVLANVDEGLAENLVAKYAYVMGTTKKWARVRSILRFKNGANHHMAWDYPIERKSRVEASPFGFHLTGADLSARQLSILAALGISKFL